MLAPMPRVQTEMVVAAPIETVWAFHADVGNMLRVVPMNMRPHVLKLHERFEPGAEFVLRLGFAYSWLHWHGRITEVDPPKRFADEMVAAAGPFAAFAHEHRFERVDDDHTRLIETLDYRLRWGLLGQLVNALLIRRQIRAMFAFRRRILPRAMRAWQAEAG